MNVMQRTLLVAAMVAATVTASAPPAEAQTIELINSFAGCPPEGCGPGDDAATPVNALVLGPDGNFYGTSPIDQHWWAGETVPRGWGTVFRVTPGGARTILHYFPGSGPGGCGSSSVTFGADGRLYGVGARCGWTGSDTIYRIDGTSFETIQEFPADQGLQLFSIVAASNGAFYGVGSQPSGDGVDSIIYKWDGLTFTALRTAHSTTYSRSGFSERLIPAPDGSFYFIASSTEIHPPFGDATHSGSILRLRPDDVIEGVAGAEFDDSGFPNGDLIMGYDGRLYGSLTTYPGGDPGYPAPPQYAGLYRLTLNGILTRLSTSGRVTPIGAGVDGSVYVGSSFGAINRLTPDGTEVRVPGFDGNAGRISALTRGRDGNFYGVTERGGDYDVGIYFRIRMPSVDMKANGADGPVTVGAGTPLQISMGFDAASDAVTPAEVYLAVVTPALQIIWTTPSGFSLTPTPIYSGPLPSFPLTTLVNIPDAAVLPPGDYYWVAIVDADANLVPNGHYVDFVKTTKVSAAAALQRKR